MTKNLKTSGYPEPKAKDDSLTIASYLSAQIQNLDKWSDETIKNSFIGNLLNSVNNFLNQLQRKAKSQLYINSMLLISIMLLFVSLSLPYFANDRFGIGILIIFCFFIFILNIVFNKPVSLNFNSIDLLLLIFLLISTISTASSYFFKESFIGLLKYFVFFLCYIILKVTVLNSSKKIFFNLSGGLFLCSVITAAIGIYQYVIGVEPLANWEDPGVENIHTRVYSTVGNPNLLAGYLLLILPVGITLPFEMKSNLFYKIFFLIGSFLILLCLIFTGSRGGYVGLITGTIFSIIIFLFYLINRRDTANRTSTTIIFLIITTIVLLALIFLFPILRERMLTIFTFREHSSNNYRINVWLSCLKMFKDNWFIGIGPGNSTFRLAYGLYMVSGFDALAAYNIFLELALEVGILGCLTFIFIFLISFIKLHCLFWQKGKILALGIFISLISLLTQGFVDTVLFRPQVFVPFWFLLASIDTLGVDNFRNTKEKIRN